MRGISKLEKLHRTCQLLIRISLPHFDGRMACTSEFWYMNSMASRWLLPARLSARENIHDIASTFFLLPELLSRLAGTLLPKTPVSGHHLFVIGSAAPPQRWSTAGAYLRSRHVMATPTGEDPPGFNLPTRTCGAALPAAGQHNPSNFRPSIRYHDDRR